MSTFRDWMYKRKGDAGLCSEFIKGVEVFLDFAFSPRGITGGTEMSPTISCPCQNCKHRYYHIREEVKYHLYRRGFIDNYLIWTCNGESTENYGSEYNNVEESSNANDAAPEENFHSHREPVFDAFPQFQEYDTNDLLEEPNDEAKLFYELLAMADKPVYEGHDQSLLHWVSRVMTYKTSFNASQAATNEYIKGGRSMAPPQFQHKIPDNYSAFKNMMMKLGLGVIKYDVCENNCFLYYKEGQNSRACPVCGENRYEDKRSINGKDVPKKKLWYFPVGERLKRLYMSRKTAKHMTWHTKCRGQSDRVIHPAGSEAWKHFDRTYEEFAAEPRNVRLGLSTDGFSPFRSNHIKYSCWPVFVTPYNLPPDLCMRQEFIFLSLIISGPDDPGKKIDVLLRPLIDELKMLWSEGVETYDCYKKQIFLMKAAILWTISDFPAYAMLSGWSTKGRLACPYCMELSDAFWLNNGRKHSWFDCHRCFLPKSHPYRRNKKNFKRDRVEHRARLERRSGVYIKDAIDKLANVPFGEEIPGFGDVHNWTKKSIFWELPYWSTLLVRHNLDVMHCEKNFFDNILNTLMDILKKTKDNKEARMDLELHTTRSELFLPEDKSKKPKATYTLSREQRRAIFEWLKALRFPDGHVSNISNRVNLQTNKISGLKTHDCHVFMQRLLPIAFRNFLPEPIWGALTEVSNLFKALCTSEIRPADMEVLQKTVVETICKLETIFPPAFFDSMEHLIIHLPYEARVCGPVFYHWMYPFERRMFILKESVKNKNRVEGSICEAYLMSEVTNFCSYYFSADIDTPSTRLQRNEIAWAPQFDRQLSIFNPKGQPIGVPSKERLGERDYYAAILYIIMNCAEAQPYVSEFENQLGSHIKDREREFARINDLVPRLENLVATGHRVDDRVAVLLRGGSRIVNKYRGYIVNGFRFHTESYGSRRTTMNSGVCVRTENESGGNVNYYGMLQEVIELTFRNTGFPEQKIHLFRCDWYDPRGVTVHKKYGLVDLHPDIWLTNEPFVMANQATQVYYARYPSPRHGRRKRDVWVVCPIRARQIVDVSSVAQTIGPEQEQAYYQEEEPIIIPEPPFDSSDLNHQLVNREAGLVEAHDARENEENIVESSEDE